MNPATVYIHKEIKELIPGFFKITRNDIRSARESLRRDDYVVVYTVGHRCEGDGASYGFDLLTELGRKLKDAAKAKDKAEAAYFLNEMEDYLEQVQIIWN